MWSINERLGGKEGLEIPAPSDNWLNDILLINQRIAEKQQRDKEDDPFGVMRGSGWEDDL